MLVRCFEFSFPEEKNRNSIKAKCDSQPLPFGCMENRIKNNDEWTDCDGTDVSKDFFENPRDAIAANCE